jgi:hypothetical protein
MINNTYRCASLHKASYKETTLFHNKPSQGPHSIPKHSSFYERILMAPKSPYDPQHKQVIMAAHTTMHSYKWQSQLKPFTPSSPTFLPRMRIELAHPYIKTIAITATIKPVSYFTTQRI